MEIASSPLPKLLKGERDLKVKEFDSIIAESLPKYFKSSLRAILRLSKANRLEEIGQNGPVMAAESISLHEHIEEFEIYRAIFGRDSLRVSRDLLDQFPRLAESTLLTLAHYQGLCYDDKSEEEPGRIAHEIRDIKNDHIAQVLMKERGWKFPYYGSVDATVAYVLCVIDYCSKLNSVDFLNSKYVDKNGDKRDMTFSFEAALEWIVNRLKANTEGLLDYKSSNPNGIENQVWKDSWDSYFDQNNTMADHSMGIASFEVQVMVYEALRKTIDFCGKFNLTLKPLYQLEDLNSNLGNRIMNDFWTDENGGYFVLALDHDKSGRRRQLKVKTSNMGYILSAGTLEKIDPAFKVKSELAIEKLFNEELLSFSGIRTLAADEIRFRPGSYHNGSVWIFDNYQIIRGLDSLGYFGLSAFLKNVLLDSVNTIQFLPEFLRGDLDFAHRINTRIVDVYDEINSHVNRIEQPPQDIQAWSASSILAIKSEKHILRHASDKAKCNFEERILDKIPFKDRIKCYI